MKSLNVRSFLLSAFLLCFFLIPTNAQDTEKDSVMKATWSTTGDTAAHYITADKMVQELKEPLALSEEQVNEIREILIEHHEELAEINMEESEEKSDGNEMEAEEEADEERDEALIDVMDEIAGVLEENQQAMWIKIQNDWWRDARVHIHTDSNK
jgi:hypothetical protein